MVLASSHTVALDVALTATELSVLSALELFFSFAQCAHSIGAQWSDS